MVAAGQHIERVVVLSSLGRGGLAEVWLVRHIVLDCLLALKVPYPSSSPDQLIKEGRAQAALSHPNTVPVLDVLQVDGAPALLMPFIPGPSLDVVLQHHKPGAHEAEALLYGIVQGLAFAHQHGFVHGDLKPSNILLHPRHDAVYPRIADFGLGGEFGTRAFASPEQLAGQIIGLPSDLFSLSRLAEHLFGGHPVPPVIGQCAAPDPHARPTHAQAVLEQLAEPPRGPLSLGSAWVRGLAPWSRPVPGPNRPSGSTSGHNLPASRNRFIPRESVQTKIVDALQRSRLVTLLGLGGIGKTRLAIEVARSLRPNYPGGTWLCSVSQAEDRPGLVGALAQGLSLQLGTNPEAQLLAAVQGRGHALFVIDNLEHILDPASEILQSWLDHAPHATVLVTSREPTHLQGEARIQVPPLTPEQAQALFLERARSADGDFGITPDLAPLLERLDGLPLAIELTAARAPLFGVSRLLERFGDGLDLASSDRALPARQRTMRATLDWSWKLLTQSERGTLARAAIFEGPFTLEAAEAVLGTESPGGAAFLDVMSSLVDKGLLVRRPGKEPRLTLLGLVRAFVMGQHPPPPAAYQRHAQWFGDLTSPLPADLNDLLAACRWACHAQRRELAVPVAHAAWAILARLGPFERATRMLEEVITLADRDPSLRCHAVEAYMKAGQRDAADRHLAAALTLADTPLTQARSALTEGRMHWSSGEVERTIQAFQRALALAEEAGALAEEAHACHGLGQVAFSQGDDAAKGYLDRAQAGFRACGDRVAEAELLANLARHAEQKRDLATAQALLNEALERFQELGHPHNEAHARSLLGAVRARMGQSEAGRQTMERALLSLQRQGDRRGVAAALGNLGAVACDAGQFDDAEKALARALEEYTAVGDRLNVANTWYNLGATCARRGDYARARDAYRKAFNQYEERGHLRAAANCLERLTAALSLLGELDEADRTSHEARARLTTIQDRRGLGWLTFHDGLRAMERGLIDVAASAIRDSLAVAEELEDAPLKATALIHYADLMAPHDPVAAQRAIDESSAPLHAMPGASRRVRLLVRRLLAEIKLDRLVTAGTTLLEAEAILEDLTVDPSDGLWAELENARQALNTAESR